MLGRAQRTISKEARQIDKLKLKRRVILKNKRMGEGSQGDTGRIMPLRVVGGDL